MPAASAANTATGFEFGAGSCEREAAPDSKNHGGHSCGNEFVSDSNREHFGQRP